MSLHLSDKTRRASELLLAAKAFDGTLDLRALTRAVDERRELLWYMAQAVRDQAFDVVAAGDTAGAPYGAWLAELTGLPFIVAGQGALKPGEKVLLAGDRAGAWIPEALRLLRDAGAVCEHAVVVFHDGGVPPDAGITLHHLSAWPQLLDAAEQFKTLPAEQIQALRVNVGASHKRQQTC